MQSLPPLPTRTPPQEKVLKAKGLVTQQAWERKQYAKAFAKPERRA